MQTTQSQCRKRVCVNVVLSKWHNKPAIRSLGFLRDPKTCIVVFHLQFVIHNNERLSQMYCGRNDKFLELSALNNLAMGIIQSIRLGLKNRLLIKLIELQHNNIPQSKTTFYLNRFSTLLKFNPYVHTHTHCFRATMDHVQEAKHLADFQMDSKGLVL